MLFRSESLITAQKLRALSSLSRGKMRHFKIILTLFLFGIWVPVYSQPAERFVDDFRLQSTEGQWISLSDYKNAKGFIIVFTCNHCPFAQLYTQRFNDLYTRYRPLGVHFIAVNSMDSLIYEDETMEIMKRKAQSEQFLFPYLQDPDQRIGKIFGSDATPQVFVVWIENGKYQIRYSGAIDDNGEHPEVAHSYVKATLDSLFKGLEVEIFETKSFGCRIHYRK